MDELIFYGGVVILLYCISVVILDLLYRCDFVYDTTYDVFILEENKENSELYDQYNYILDNGLSAEEIFVKYVNQQKGYDYISTDDLLDILNDL